MTQDIEDPLVVSSADNCVWHDSADVIVIGFGAAGASAALEAHEKAPGTEVLLIDRFEGGGATAYSGGIVYAGATRHQRDAGYEDSADEMYKYLKLEVGDAVSDKTLRRFCDDSNDNLNWLERHGVKFGSTLCKTKTTYPPNGQFLYFSGNEKVAKYLAAAKPAPRGHRTVGKGFTGQAMFDALAASVASAGIRTMQHAPVTRLVTDRAGNVLGVELNAIPTNAHPRHQSLYRELNPLIPFRGRHAEKMIASCQAFEKQVGERRMVRARRGVVLSTGGFIYNMTMLNRHANANLAASALRLMRLGSMGCSGAGIRLGMSAGGATARMDSIFTGRTIAPPSAPVEGIVVNSAGRRFISEDTYLGFLGEAIGHQPDGTAWLVLDGATFRKYIGQLLPNGDGNFFVLKLPAILNLLFGGTCRAASLDRLAAKCGIDDAGLRDEVTRFNQDAAKGYDPLGKSSDYLRPLGNGPYVAINLSLSNPFANTLTFTLGGLKVDEDSGRVLRPDGSGIEGLYAAGRAAVGVCSNGYFSGMSLADCVFSGRRAGSALAALAAKHRE